MHPPPLTWGSFVSPLGLGGAGLSWAGLGWRWAALVLGAALVPRMRLSSAEISAAQQWPQLPSDVDSILDVLVASDPESVQLKEPTRQAFDAYVGAAEAVMDRTLHESGLFLWADTAPERPQIVREGHIEAHRSSGSGSVPVPDGLIHDWIGTVFVSGRTVNETLALVQDYDNHKNIYKPEVIDSALRSREDNNFHIYLRLRKKKVVTAVLDTDHDVHYISLDPTHWSCRSYTTRIAEVENAGRADEEVLPPDTGHGFLWRLHSYWRFRESDGGVYIECRAISLTRDIPTGLGWIVRPIIRQLPRESLIHTLSATRKALASRRIEASPGSSPNCPGASSPEELPH